MWQHHIVVVPGCSATRLSYISCGLLEGVEGVSHCITTNVDGADISYRTCADGDRVTGLRSAVCARLMAPLDRLTMADQVHAATVTPVTQELVGMGARSWQTAIPNTDGLITNLPGVALGVCVADCVPVLLCDPVSGAIGAIHSGWRSTAQAIVPKAIALMRERYGVDPVNLRASVGPSIQGSCYEVGSEVVQALGETVDIGGATRPNGPGKWLLDLPGVVCAQLTGCGIDRANISVAPWCTHCEPALLHSHRRDGLASGRLGAFTART